MLPEKVARLVLVSVVVTAALTFSSGNAQAADWVLYSGDFTDWLSHNNIVLDRAGLVHIAYFARNIDGAFQLKYARQTSIYTWTTTSVGPLEQTIAYPHIALDASNRPHISYAVGFPLKMKYARWDGTQWITGPTIFSTGGPNGIAIDRLSGSPRIAFSDAGAVYYAKWTGNSWNIATVEVVPSPVGLSLVLDSQNNPRIVYEARATNTLLLHHAAWTGSSWDIAPFELGDWEGGHPGLAVVSGGKSVISYRAGALFLMVGPPWAVQLPPLDLDPQAGFVSSIALDASGAPHIAYTTNPSSTLKYASQNPDGGWNIEPVDVAGLWASLAIGGCDVPHFSYGRAQYLYYATQVCP